MALDTNLKQQLAQYLDMLEDDIVLHVATDSSAVSLKMLEFSKEVSSLSSRVTVEEVNTVDDLPAIHVNRSTGQSGIAFAGVPLGHEFASFVLAMLQVSGRTPKLEESVIDRIKEIRGDYNFKTYISLSCHNCPDVVQALNAMAALNPNVKHTMIDGGAFKELVESKDILAVPYVEMNGEFFISGKTEIEDILAKIGADTDASKYDGKVYDSVIVGGGPAAVAAAVYLSRKGVSTAMVAERFGGQVSDTMDIENLIGTPKTTGPKLVDGLKAHVTDYDIDVIKGHRVESFRTNTLKLDNGARVSGKTVIIATGARWRNLGVPGEQEFKNRGVAYCPHCDGPLFKGKHVAVIGGGNSGVEAAIDLAGIVKHVTVFEFMPELKADAILQKKLRSLDNVDIVTNVATKEIVGEDRVTGIVYEDRDTGETAMLELAGVFIQIGLVPNTDWVPCDKNRFGEIEINNRGETSLPGVFAAGDCTTVPYKQIVISIGAGATAALSAFDYLIRE